MASKRIAQPKRRSRVTKGRSGRKRAKRNKKSKLKQTFPTSVSGKRINADARWNRIPYIYFKIAGKEHFENLQEWENELQRRLIQDRGFNWAVAHNRIRMGGIETLENMTNINELTRYSIIQLWGQTCDRAFSRAQDRIEAAIEAAENRRRSRSRSRG